MWFQTWKTQTSLKHVKNQGELMCSPRVCSSCSTSGIRRSCSAILDRWLLLRKTLLNQGFLVVNLKSSLFWHCDGLHLNLVNRYRISGSQMTTCMFRLSLWQSGPFFMTYHWVFNKSNTTDATSGAGTTYPWRAH
jgi:hypothetical protein